MIKLISIIILKLFFYGGLEVKLNDLNIGDRAVVKKIDTSESLKQRLLSFGVGRGAKISVEKYSIGKKTFEILVDGTLIALRDEEAKKIEVEKIDE